MDIDGIEARKGRSDVGDIGKAVNLGNRDGPQLVLP